jgi:hypothetical protein
VAVIAFFLASASQVLVVRIPFFVIVIPPEDTSNYVSCYPEKYQI